jgi:hypothetical protein
VLFVEIVLEGWGGTAYGYATYLKGAYIFVRIFETSIMIGRKERD